MELSRGNPVNQKKYVYIFTRQDISPEYQLVQSAHAAMKVGRNAYIADKSFDPDNTYFTVVGVRNQEALFAVGRLLSHYGFRHVEFVEPDIGDQLTSIATYPIPEDRRDVLLAFSWLRF